MVYFEQQNLLKIIWRILNKWILFSVNNVCTNMNHHANWEHPQTFLKNSLNKVIPLNEHYHKDMRYAEIRNIFGDTNAGRSSKSGRIWANSPGSFGICAQNHFIKFCFDVLKTEKSHKYESAWTVGIQLFR